MSSAQRLRRIIAAGWRDESGGIAIITALLLPLLVAMAGFATDYAYAAYVKQRLDRAAEAAVIGAVSQSAATAMGGYSNTNGLSIYGTGLFNANASQLKVGTVTPNMSVVSNGSNGVIATVNYSASVDTLFSGIIGINSFPVKGSASAKASALVYINYYIVVDISQSMGIGATQTDMANLFNRIVAYKNGDDPSNPTEGCVFACHVRVNSQPYSNEYVARNINPPITLRVDAARSAVQNIIMTAKKDTGTNQNVRIGLYTMSRDPVSGKLLNTLSSPSTDYAALTTLANGIALGNNNSGGLGDSDFSNQLAQFNGILPANGSGASAASPLNYVFIVTDGLTDAPGGSCTWGHCMAALSPSFCTPLKSKATVGVIYTTYLPIYKNNDPSQGFDNRYDVLAKPYVNQIKPNLQACASSSNFFFEASDGPAITAGMDALFRQAQQSALLTR